MTYGWAILIIAVVLGALFQLGVFNAINFEPKAQPGACQVVRPNGPNTTSIVSLEGTCTGELPQTVAQFNGNSYINISDGLFLAGSIPQITITGWEKGSQGGTIFTLNGESIDMRTNYMVFDVCSSSGNTNLPSMPVDALDGKWHFIAVSINANTMIGYIDSYNSSAVVPYSYQTSPPKAYIGACLSCANGASFPWGLWIGQLANIQVYDTSLSPSEIRALYLEGIGGAPIDLQNLVGWWPLNGNANDYSGNDNNGVPYNGVMFVSNWWSGYTPP